MFQANNSNKYQIYKLSLLDANSNKTESCQREVYLFYQYFTFIIRTLNYMLEDSYFFFLFLVFCQRMLLTIDTKCKIKCLHYRLNSK